jgi:hypothetical protein
MERVNFLASGAGIEFQAQGMIKLYFTSTGKKFGPDRAWDKIFILFKARAYFLAAGPPASPEAAIDHSGEAYNCSYGILCAILWIGIVCGFWLLD